RNAGTRSFQGAPPRRTKPRATCYSVSTGVGGQPPTPKHYLIRKLSSFLPFLSRGTSHLGRAPRPDQSSPLGPRYLGATFRPARVLPLRRGIGLIVVPPFSRAIWLCSSSAFLLSTALMSSRILIRASMGRGKLAWSGHGYLLESVVCPYPIRD